MENWDKIQYLLENESDIAKVTYTGFIKDLKPIRVENDTVIILAEDQMCINIIEKKYLKFILVAISEVMQKSYDIQFVIEDTVKNQELQQKLEPKHIPSMTTSDSNLNTRYTFDTFVVGNNNKFANAAALAVAEAPAEAYNPLFIYGGVGLGKTHLMHSVAHFILDDSPNTKVLYVSSEKFTNELINSIRTDKNEAFRQKYRDIDVLLIDDIQFIAGKERTQEEFFHTFNTLYEAKKQIIISSDRPPKEIETLEDRLRSRFEWGLIADIQAPDFETRIAILRNKADLENLDLDDEVLQYVATNIKSNIRELEGAVNKIVAYSRLVKMDNEKITKQIAEDALRDLIAPPEENIVTPELIMEVVASHYNITHSDIISKKRPREIAYPRQIVMYLCRKLTDTSLPHIGEILGNRDHSTVLHGYEKIKKDIEKDSTLKNSIDILTKKITGK